MTSTPPAARRPRRRGAEQTWTLLHEFVTAHSRHGELADALGFRLGAGRGKILFQLRHGPLTLTQLAQANGFDAPYTTLVVDKLEAHGLVERRPHPDDRRRRLITLTPAGNKAIAAADAILRRPPRAFDALGADDVDHLGALLHRLTQADSARP